MTNKEEKEYYFLQYWGCTNPQIFLNEELKNALLDIYCEVWNYFKDYNGEDKLFRLGEFYKERILKGKRVYDK